MNIFGVIRAQAVRRMVLTSVSAKSSTTGRFCKTLQMPHTVKREWRKEKEIRIFDLSKFRFMDATLPWSNLTTLVNSCKLSTVSG